MAVLLVGLLVAAVGWAALSPARRQPAGVSVASVTRIASVGHFRDRKPLVVITAQTADGRQAQALILVNQMRCSVGDTIDARSNGASVSIDPKSCRPRGGPA